MRDAGTIIYWIIWGIALIAFAITLLIVFNLNLFPPKRMKNLRFKEIKMGQVFYDYGGEEAKIRKYIKTSEFEAKCLSISGHPTVSFDKMDFVKVEIYKD